MKVFGGWALQPRRHRSGSTRSKARQKVFRSMDDLAVLREAVDGEAMGGQLPASFICPDRTYEEKTTAGPGFRGLQTKNHYTHRHNAQNRQQRGHNHRQ